MISADTIVIVERLTQFTQHLMLAYAIDEEQAPCEGSGTPRNHCEAGDEALTFSACLLV